MADRKSRPLTDAVEAPRTGPEVETSFLTADPAGGRIFGN